jgi:hypothetical protein
LIKTESAAFLLGHLEPDYRVPIRARYVALDGLFLRFSRRNHQAIALQRPLQPIVRITGIAFGWIGRDDVVRLGREESEKGYAGRRSV